MSESNSPRLETITEFINTTTTVPITSSLENVGSLSAGVSATLPSSVSANISSNVPVSEITAVKSTTEESALIKPATGESLPVKAATNKPVKSATNFDAIDVIYQQLITGTDILALIYKIQDNGFSSKDIPGLMLTVLTAYNNNQHVSLSISDVQLLLERVYIYLVTTYNLITPENRADCFTMFAMCLKLALSTPKLQSNINSCFSFFGCK